MDMGTHNAALSGTNVASIIGVPPTVPTIAIQQLISPLIHASSEEC
jgi:hypothetical protein